MAMSTKTTTKSKRSTTKAASARPKAARATTAKTEKPKQVADKATGAVETANLSKKELIGRVMEHAGMKKGEARRAVDATMAVLGQALGEGKNIAAAPLGKMSIARQKDTANGKLVVVRIKLKDQEKMAAEARAKASQMGLAQAAE